MRDIENQITVQPVSSTALESCQGKTATREVLGSLIKRPQMVLEFPLEPDDFVDQLYKIIFAAIKNLARGGAESLDISIIEEYLQENYPAKYRVYIKNNGTKFLQQAVTLSTPENFKMNYEEIKKYSLLRRFMTAGIDVSEFHRPDEVDLSISEAITDRFKQFTVEQLGEFYKNKILKINNSFMFHSNISTAKVGGDEAMAQKELWKKAGNYGISYASNYLTCATDGIKPKRLTIMSAGTGTGKTRFTIANIGHSFAPEIWDMKTKSWIKNPNGTQNRCLYIGTEMELREEVEPILEAYVSKVPQQHIQHPDQYEPGEEERVNYAIESMGKGYIYLAYLPEFCAATLEETISHYVFDCGVTHVFFDYIHTTANLFAEYRRETGQEGREDQVLASLSNKLKDWTRKYNISIDTWTQVTGEFGNESIRDQRLVRGSKALIDKADVAAIMMYPSEHELKKIDTYLRKDVIRGKIVCLSVYKVRNGAHNNIKIWLDVEYDTMRVHDLFVTNYSYELYEDIDPVTVILNEDTNTFQHYKNYNTMMKVLNGGTVEQKEAEPWPFDDEDEVDLNSIETIEDEEEF